MAKTNKPKTDTDRLTVSKQVPEAIKRSPLVPSMVTTMQVEELLPTFTRFEETYELRAQAIATNKAARVEGKALDEKFDVAFRMFTPTVRDERGVGASGELAKMAGGILPSDLVKHPLHEEHLHTAEILRQVPLRSDLSYDATRYAELAAVHAKLPGMISTLATTALAVKTTTDDHYASRASFDSVYGRFRSVVRAAGGDALVRALLPEFISRDPKEYDEPSGDDNSEVVSDVDSDVSQSGGGDSGGGA